MVIARIVKAVSAMKILREKSFWSLTKQVRAKGEGVGHDASLCRPERPDEAREIALNIACNPKKPHYSECRQQSMLIQAMPSNAQHSERHFAAMVRQFVQLTYG